MTKKPAVPPIIENLIGRLQNSSSINEKENLCQTLQTISLEIDKAVRNARAFMNKTQVRPKR
jgi:hypothetical protein